jgi:CHASE2 domain-containing sensor protein/signal transduction histidine kinase
LNPFTLPAPDSRYARLVTALAIAGIIWGLGTLGALRTLDGIAYDLSMRFRSGFLRERARVLLVEIESRGSSEEVPDLAALIRRLGELGASGIVFTFLPPDSAKDIWLEAEKMGRVVFPRIVGPDPFHPGQLRSVLPATTEERPGTSQGVLESPPGTAGVHRSHHASFIVDGAVLPSLEARAAEEVLGERASLAGGEFLVDFRGGPGSIPAVSVSRVLSGDLIREIVEEKTVLVGVMPPPPAPGLSTPTTTGHETMSLLEYQGHALNTLLSRRAIRSLGDGGRLVLLAGIALLSSSAYQWLGIQIASWLTAGLLAAYAAGGLAAFTLGSTWLPLTECVLCQTGLYLMALRHRAIRLTQSLQKAISDSSAKLKDKYWPIHSRTQAPSWPLIANMINQTLDLNKLIFLEADTREGKVREILALHCTLDDIVERRRDYGRPPYSDALKVKGPLKVKKFLRTKNPKEEHYLAPLVFSGEILGFWAMGIDAEKAAATPGFTALLRDYGARMSEMLYHARKEAQKESLLDGLKRRIGTECTDETYQELSATLGLLHQRLSTLDLLINRLGSGIIVYDIFGRVLQVNELMLSILRRENLAPFEMTALDIILALSDYDISKSRGLLRRVIVENGAVSFPVTLRSSSGNRFLFRMRPLFDEVEGEGTPAARRIGTRSILCELIDTSALTSLHELKNRLTDRLGLELRGGLAAIQLSASLLGRKTVGDDDRVKIARLMSVKVGDVMGTLNECRRYLTIDSDGEELERFPVDPRASLAAALEEAKETARKRGVEVQLVEPSFTSYVFASTAKLKDLFAAILKVLCQDAADNSQVVVKISENEDVAAFDFSNVGFGIPDELLQSYVFGDLEIASDEFRKIRSAARLVEAWGGVLEASSGVGVGIHFTLHLVKFL